MGEPFSYATGKYNASDVNLTTNSSDTSLNNILTNSSFSDLNSTVPSNASHVATTEAAWSDGVSIGIPAMMIILFVLVQIFVFFVKRKRPPHIRVPVQLHVSAKSDLEEKPVQSEEKKVTISPDKDEVFGGDDLVEERDERTIETPSDVDRMRLNAKEQAKKSRKGRQISLKSITSMVSRNSSQFDYSELEEQDTDGGAGMDNQLVMEADDDSDTEVDTTGAEGDLGEGAALRDSSMITVTVEHHSPPKHLLVDVEGSDQFGQDDSKENLMSGDTRL